MAYTGAPNQKYSPHTYTGIGPRSEPRDLLERQWEEKRRDILHVINERETEQREIERKRKEWDNQTAIEEFNHQKKCIEYFFKYYIRNATVKENYTLLYNDVKKMVDLYKSKEPAQFPIITHELSKYIDKLENIPSATGIRYLEEDPEIKYYYYKYFVCENYFKQIKELGEELKALSERWVNIREQVLVLKNENL